MISQPERSVYGSRPFLLEMALKWRDFIMIRILPELMGGIAVELMSQNPFEPYKVHVFDALADFR